MAKILTFWKFLNLLQIKAVLVGCWLTLMDSLTVKKGQKKLKTYWKCSKRISSKCCARVSTVEMNIVSRSGQHNHLPP